MNIKLKNAMLYVLLSIFMSFPMFAMEMKENEIKDGHITSALMERLELYRNQLTNLKEEKLKLESDLEDFDSYKKKLTDSEHEKSSLEKEKLKLESDLEEADRFLEYILKSTPTLFNYLSAFSNPDTDKDELAKLRVEASKEKNFKSILVRSNKQVKAQTPLSMLGILKMHKDRIKIEEDHFSAGYVTVSVESTPDRIIKKGEETVNKVRSRTSSLGTASKNLFGEEEKETESSDASSTEEITSQIDSLNIKG